MLLYQLYPDCYAAFTHAGQGRDPIGDFLDYVELANRPSDWRRAAEKVFAAYRPPGSRSHMDFDDLDAALADLKRLVPEPLTERVGDGDLVSLLQSLGDADSRAIIGEQLAHNPLRSPQVNSATFGLSREALAAALGLNTLGAELQTQVMGTEGAAATQQAQYQALQIESDPNNTAANSVAQPASHEMRTNSEIFQTFDGIMNG